MRTLIQRWENMSVSWDSRFFLTFSLRTRSEIRPPNFSISKFCSSCFLMFCVIMMMYDVGAMLLAWLLKPRMDERISPTFVSLNYCTTYYTPRQLAVPQTFLKDQRCTNTTSCPLRVSVSVTAAHSQVRSRAQRQQQWLILLRGGK